MRKVSLTDVQRQFVELMQHINFGRIERLPIRNNSPVLDPPPKIVREIKFGSENGPRPERSAADFALKAQVIELFREFDKLCDGTVEVLVVKHGLPFSMETTARLRF